MKTTSVKQIAGSRKSKHTVQSSNGKRKPNKNSDACPTELDTKLSHAYQDFLQNIEVEFNKFLQPVKLKLTKAEQENMASDLMRFIPHLHLLDKMVTRTCNFAYEFFEKYGQDSIVKAGNTRNWKQSANKASSKLKNVCIPCTTGRYAKAGT